MKTSAKLLSLIALAMVVVPCLLYFENQLSHAAVLNIGLIGTIAWFITTPIWLDKETPR